MWHGEEQGDVVLLENYSGYCACLQQIGLWPRHNWAVKETWSKKRIRNLLFFEKCVTLVWLKVRNGQKTPTDMKNFLILSLILTLSLVSTQICMAQGVASLQGQSLATIDSPLLSTEVVNDVLCLAAVQTGRSFGELKGLYNRQVISIIPIGSGVYLVSKLGKADILISVIWGLGHIQGGHSSILPKKEL